MSPRTTWAVTASPTCRSGRACSRSSRSRSTCVSAPGRSAATAHWRASRIERAYAQFPILAERRRQAAGTLSGGQQRQLEIARALLTDPTVMLIDEPTASIEPRIAAQIYALIAGLARDGKAILLVDSEHQGCTRHRRLCLCDAHRHAVRAKVRAAFSDDVETLVAAGCIRLTNG